MKGILTKLPIFIALLWITGCTNQNLASDKKEGWIFAHIATQAFIPNKTSVIIPVTQNIIAFTQDPYQAQAGFTGAEFASLLEKENRGGSRHAVLSWLNGKDIEELRLVVIDVAISDDQQSMIYTTEAMRSLSGVRKLVSPHLYVDSYQSNKNNYANEYRYPFHDDSYYSHQRTEYAKRHRIPTGKKQ